MIEDEIHFICQCEKYSQLRNELYENVQKDFPDFCMLNDKEKFIYLLVNEFKLTSKYICNIWTIRSQTLYN